MKWGEYSLRGRARAAPAKRPRAKIECIFDQSERCEGYGGVPMVAACGLIYLVDSSYPLPCQRKVNIVEAAPRPVTSNVVTSGTGTIDMAKPDRVNFAARPGCWISPSLRLYRSSTC